MELYEILTNRRRELGISIDDIVSASGIPKGTVSKIMAGITKDPGIETLRSIVYALGLTLDDLSEEKQPVSLDGLAEDERRFLSGFASLSPSNRRLLLGILSLLLQEQGQTPSDSE